VNPAKPSRLAAKPAGLIWKNFATSCPGSPCLIVVAVEINKNHNMSTTKKPTATDIVWFEIAADDTERARKFYRELFGWKIERFPGPHEYWRIDTGGAEAAPDGAIKKRKQPQEPVVNYFSVGSVAEQAKKVEQLGGKICMGKTAVPQMGYFAVCQDTEGNAFGLWENNPNAG